MMMYINAFLFVGLVSLIGELILDNTKLTSGHVTSILVVIGAILSFFGIYDKLIDFAGVGASIPITSFGNLLFKACYEGFKTKGLLGMFTNMFSTTSGGITAAIIFAAFFTLFTRPKD